MTVALRANAIPRQHFLRSMQKIKNSFAKNSTSPSHLISSHSFFDDVTVEVFIGLLGSARLLEKKVTEFKHLSLAAPEDDSLKKVLDPII